MSAMSFARFRQAINSERVLGNIGEPIEYGQWDQNVYEEEVEEDGQGEQVQEIMV